MAGGRGVRLGSITKKTPKPIIKINNKPYLEYLLNWLSRNGFKKFYFFLSYKNKKIQNYLNKYFLSKNLDYKIFIDTKRRGTFCALQDHLRKIEKIFFYTNADEISNFNIKKIFLNYKKSKTKIMCSLLKSKKSIYTINKVNKQILIKTNSKQISYKDCGFKFINKEIFKKSKVQYQKIEDFIYLDYLKKNKVSYFIVKKLPLRIDTALDIKRTKKELHDVK